MSSVVASKRKMSKTEFFDFAFKLNKEMVELVLREFGVKAVNRDLKAFTYSAKMNSIDAMAFKNICEKYHVDVETSYPLYILEHYRNKILDLLSELIDNIVAANTIYASSISEFYYRRQFQWKAICNCRQLLTTMQIAMQTLPVDANKLMKYVLELEHEMDLLKEWKKSDNKILEAIKKKEVIPETKVTQNLIDNKGVK